MGNRHALAWSALPNAQVAVVVDPNEARARSLAHKVGALCWFSDYASALALPELDVVSVCIPTAAHAEVTIAAANAGKHVFCEKPIALTLEDADRMIAAARENHVKLGIGLVRRYSPVMHVVRQRLQAGDLGRPVMYQAVDAREQRPKLIMHDVAATGGAVIDMGVHVFDGWRFVFNSEPVSVYAQGLKLADGRPDLAGIPALAYDSAMITVRYRSGDIGHFMVTWGLPLGVNPPEQPDRIFGPCGMAEIAYGVDSQVFRWNLSGAWETVASADREMYRLEIEAFAAAILDDRPPLTSGEDAKEALRVALAALESIETGQVVFLP